MISDFFQDKLRLPVEYFNPLKKVSVAQQVDIEKVSIEAHQLGEIIGLGLRSLDLSRLNIDLVPEKVQQERDDARKRPKLIIAACVLIAASALFCVNGYTSKSNAIKAAAEQDKVEKGLTRYAVPITAELNDVKTIASIATLYSEAVASKAMWLVGLRDIKKYFAHPELWIIEMEPVLNFDPLKKEGDNSIKTIVSNRIEKAIYGASLITLPKLEPETISGGRPNPAYMAPMINAIKVRGYWRSESNGLVLTQLQELIEKSEYFTNEIVRKPGNEMKPETLTTPDIVIENATSPANDKLGAPFTLIIPLSNPILLK